jgi:hypothetical protein
LMDGHETSRLCLTFGSNKVPKLTDEGADPQAHNLLAAMSLADPLYGAGLIIRNRTASHMDLPQPFNDRTQSVLESGVLDQPFNVTLSRLSEWGKLRCAAHATASPVRDDHYGEPERQSMM